MRTTDCRLPGFIRGSVAVSLTLLIVSAAAREANADWVESYDTAVEASQATGLPLLIHFHATYCGPCRRMNREVFQSSVIRRALSDGLLAVEVNTALDPEIAERFRAETVPRDVLLLPDGRFETLNIGYRNHDAYLSMLRSISRDFRPPAVVTLDSQIADEIPADELVEENPKLDKDRIIGLGAFCPVEMTTKRTWTDGRSDLAVVYRGIEYRMSSPEALATFKSNPSRYVPQVLGCDPVVLYRSDRAVPGELKFGAFFDQKLYLFTDAATRAEFKQSPLKYTRIRHALNVEQIERNRL